MHNKSDKKESLTRIHFPSFSEGGGKSFQTCLGVGRRNVKSINRKNTFSSTFTPHLAQLQAHSVCVCMSQMFFVSHNFFRGISRDRANI